MSLQPTIVSSQPLLVAGLNTQLSLTQYTIASLWQAFMPIKNSIPNTISKDLFSVSVYPDSYFQQVNPATPYTKWAAVQVTSFDAIPPAFQTLIIPEGLYAVFHYKGLSSDMSIFSYIFKEWLPNSGYALDNRPHLEVLGEKYKNNSPDSEEDIWIPVIKK
jgi:AraC family transcriptional regulator